MNLLQNKLIQTLFVVLNYCLYCRAQNEYADDHSFMKREHSLVKPYQGAGVSMPFWDFTGSVMVTNQFVRLTPDSQSKSGSIWNQVPLYNRNWEIHITFKIHGKGKELFGDGMAFWYTKERMQDGAVFGSKDSFSGLAIILDTYSNHNGPHNHQHPYISAMVNNGTMTYDHDADGTHTQLAGCEAKIRNIDYETLISIRYENDVLSVSTDLENKNQWRRCFTVEGVQLPTGYFLGASALTGDLSDSHDVISIKSYELEASSDGRERINLIPRALSFEAPRERTEDKKSSGWSNIKIFFSIMLTMLGVAAIVVGIMSYQKSQKSRKRLY